MKQIITILIILALLGTAYYFIMLSVVKVSFQITFKNLDLTNISLQNLINGQATIKVKLGAKITNRNDFGIRLSDFHIWIYNDNVLIAQTADTETNLQKVYIPANGLVDVTHDIDVILNNQAIIMAKNLADGKELRFDYTTEFKVYGIKYTYKDYFSYKRG